LEPSDNTHITDGLHGESDGNNSSTLLNYI
jgi:hypothetical protein